MAAPLPLRDRQRLRSMQRVQRHAVELFTAEGFDAVTVERIAEVAEVSPVSIYRWFGTKERLVLWDDYDPGLLEAVAAQLVDQPPMAAVRDAVLAELDAIYSADRGLVLARTQLVHREPALLAAAALDARHLQSALVMLFEQAGAGDTDHGRSTLAAAAVGVLTAALDAWQSEDGRVPLGDLFRDGFEALRSARWT